MMSPYIHKKSYLCTMYKYVKSITLTHCNLTITNTVPRNIFQVSQYRTKKIRSGFWQVLKNKLAKPELDWVSVFDQWQ